MRTKKLALFFCFLYCTGCVFGPHYQRPKLHLPQHLVEEQTQLASSPKIVKTIRKKWWTLFHHQKLTQWVTESLNNHPSVHAAKFAIQAAQEQFLAQKSLDAPFIGFAYSPTRQQTARLLTSVLKDNQYDYGLITGQLYLDYTPDAFGANRRQKEALLCDLEIQNQQMRGISLFLSSAVVQTIIQESALQEQLDQTLKIIQLEEKLLKIMTEKYQSGAASLREFQIQNESLSVNKQQLFYYDEQLKIQQHILSTLLGEFTQDKKHHIPFAELHYFKPLPTLLPSALLDRRPDILTAEAQLKKANALVGLAIANRLPNINLGYSNIGTTATDMMQLFQRETVFWALAGVLTQPVFDAGRLRHSQKAAEAYYEQMKALYKNTVLNAFQNVSDTLTAIHQNELRLKEAKKAHHAALKNAEIANKMHELGKISIYDFFIIKQHLYELTISLIDAKAQRLMNTAALFEALG